MTEAGTEDVTALLEVLERGEVRALGLMPQASNYTFLAEVTLGGRLQIGPVLRVDGLVEPVLLPIGGHERGRRALTEQRLRRATGERPDPEEDQQ